MNNYKIGIVGGGPAGAAAAIQLKRYGFKLVLFEESEIGGLLRNANRVENYPGFPEGISGADLVELIRQQLEKFAVEIKYERVLKLDYDRSRFELITDKREYYFDYIVVASGTSPCLFNSDILNSDFDSRVLYEIYSIADIANKTIAILGAGDAAFDYALNLSRQNTVIIFNRGNRIKCLPLLYERAMRNTGIDYQDNARLVGIIKPDDNSLTIDISRFDEITRYDIDYLVIAIGREPVLGFLTANLLQNLETLIADGLIYFAGDVSNERYRQVAIAAGDGIKAAMKIHERIIENK